MVFGFEPGTLLVKGDSSDRGSIPGTIAYEASARCLSFRRSENLIRSFRRPRGSNHSSSTSPESFGSLDQSSV
ncbi:hypothetical protein DPMN_008389 [Dreissena polymorpha]|uniref:Uncharacterized protein n=1 Tax=Dreissena polymorpha TaxID=45954 RepID=A0A9D4MYP3_DREPO|nr:hypothetical protein DPMN_008389 [Dreissena polymorpha]